MPLATCANYISQARRILNDEVAGEYRYSDATLLQGLENGLNDMDRLRPDILLMAPQGTFLALNRNTNLEVVDRRYRRALLDYVVSYAEMVDDEAASGGRSAAFATSFAAKLMGLAL